MSYSLKHNITALFGRQAPAAAPTTPFERQLAEHYALKDDGIDRVRHLKDMDRLLNILMLNRCTSGPGLERMLELYFDNFQIDGYGNYFHCIPQPDGSEPRIAYTAHCDTVSNDLQSVYHPLCYNQEKDILFRKDGNCLGADDGTGIWLLLNMIDAKVPGLYCFYQDEETGRDGSTWSHKHNADFYQFIDTMISFDRKGTEDIIATQKGSPCCSTEFQTALADALYELDCGLRYKGGAHGSFTDSATFMDTIPECTNVAVGYDRQHGPQETQLVHHAHYLRGRLIHIGHHLHTLLPVHRDPTPKPVPAYELYNRGYYHYPDEVSAMSYEVSDYPGVLGSEIECLEVGDFFEMAEMFPDAIQSLLEDMGIDEDAVANYIAFNLFGLENIRNADTDTQSK
jgi:hypothetical protein